MRIPGYCTGCRRVRTVTVSGHAVALAAGGVVSGTCLDCERREDDQRRAEHLARPFLGRPVVLKLWRGPDVEAVLERVEDGQLILRPPGIPGRAGRRAVSIREVRHLAHPTEGGTMKEGSK